MFDEQLVEKQSSTNTTLWVETELRRLHKERHEWQARWHLLKEWLASRQQTDEDESTAGDSATLDMVVSYMNALEQETITRHSAYIPPFIVVRDCE